MSAHVFDQMLGRFMALYGDPQSENVDAFLSEFARMLAGYTPAELTRATDQIIRTHRFKTWPTVAECVSACDDARAKANSLKPKSYVSETDLFDVKRANADDLLRKHMKTAQRAAEEGWLLGLHEFVVRNGRMPSTREVYDIQETSEFVTRCSTGSVNMGFLHNSLYEMSQSILGRRERCAKRIFEGVE